MKRITVMLAALALLAAWPVAAQTKYSIWDAGKRAQVSLNAGALFFFEEETGAETSKGIAGGGALTYSLHERFSLYGLYDHVFPIDASGTHQDVIGGAANLLVYPLPGEASQTRLFIGGGVQRIDPGKDVPAWAGYEGHVTISRIFRDGWALGAKYEHIVPFEDNRRNVDMAKVWLGHRLAGAK